jgi:predicted DNA-binding transcriptional regulator AlpA
MNLHTNTSHSVKKTALKKKMQADPAISYLRSVLVPLIRDRRISIKELRNRTGLHYMTVYNIIFGEVKFPRHISVVKLQEAVGIYYHRRDSLEKTPTVIPTVSRHRVRMQNLGLRKFN